jgi:hypothetical protein
MAAMLNAAGNIWIARLKSPTGHHWASVWSATNGFVFRSRPKVDIGP